MFKDQDLHDSYKLCDSILLDMLKMEIITVDDYSIWYFQHIYLLLKFLNTFVQFLCGTQFTVYMHLNVYINRKNRLQPPIAFWNIETSLKYFHDYDSKK